MNEVSNLDQIKDLAAQGAIFYVGHSGGKDSQAMYAAVTKVVPHDQVRVIHADLGAVEHANTKDHILANIDHDLMIAEAFLLDGTPTDFFGLVRRQRKHLDTPTKKYPDARRDVPAWPDSENRFCTSDLKTGPIWREIKRDGNHEIVVNCVGIRGQESKKRGKKVAKRGTLNINKKASCNKRVQREAYDWWPIAHWSIDQVWAEIAEAGQTPHPSYAEGNERLSCAFCIFGSPNDLGLAAKRDPELLKRYIDLEIEVRSTMFNGASLADRINPTGE